MEAKQGLDAFFVVRRKKMSNPIDQLKQIFPKIEREIIEAVYESNGKSVDLAVNDLIEISGQASPLHQNRMSSVVESPRASQSDQIAKDEEYAMKLQAKETRRQSAREQSRFIREQLGLIDGTRFL